MILRIVLLLLVAAVAAGPAAAKGDVRARLLTDVPVDAAPGSRLEVAWTLSVLDEGRRAPVNADGVFVRLVGRSGDAEEGFAAGGAHPTGRYDATVAVPAGGIARVEIGVAGQQTDAAGTRRADALFPIVGPAPAADRGSGAPATWLLVAAGLLVALALADGARRALRPARPRSGAPDPGAS